MKAAFILSAVLLHVATCNAQSTGYGIPTAGQGGAAAAPATSTSPGIVQLGPNATGSTLSNVATSGSAADLLTGVMAPARLPMASFTQPGIVPLFPGGTTLFLRADGTYATPPTATSGSASAGAIYTPQLSGGAGAATIPDPFAIYTSAGNRDFYAFNGAIQTDHADGSTTGLSWGRQIMNSFHGPTWNQGSYTNAAGTQVFFTHNATGLSLVNANHASGISGSLDISSQAYQHNGDSHTIYVYSNFMPGTVLGGSDEGHADLRLSSNPSSTPTGTLASDSTTTTTGSTTIRTATLACGGSSGSSYGSGSCLGAGGWIADKALAIYVGAGSGSGVSTTGLHMSAVALVGSSPVIAATVTETFPAAEVFVSSTAQIDPPAGGAVTIAYTGATGTVPASGMGCLSSAVENVSESMNYTTSGSNITMTGIQFQHEGGDVHINLSGPCRVANFLGDEGDNGTGKTFYAVLGHPTVHTVWLTTSQGGARFAGTTTMGLSIKPDGGTYGAFQEFPGALVLDVNDPTYNATGQYFLYTPKYMHLGVNNVAWAAGHGFELGYNPADTYFMERFFCSNPLQDLNKGSACHSTTFSGSVGTMNEWVYANNVGVSNRRGLPSHNIIKFFGSNSGKYGNLYTGGAPTYGYFNMTITCANSQNSADCPDAPLLSEPGMVNAIYISRAAKALQFNATGGYTFNGGAAAFTTVNSGAATVTSLTGTTTFTNQLVPAGGTPTIVTNNGAGSPSTISLTGTNMSGVITTTSGNSPVAGSVYATVTFSGTTYATFAGCSLQPRNSAGAANYSTIFTTQPNQSTWTIVNGATAPAANTTMAWSYICE